MKKKTWTGKTGDGSAAAVWCHARYVDGNKQESYFFASFALKKKAEVPPRQFL